MFGNVAGLILAVLAAVSLVIVPGLALLRITVPRSSLDVLSRIAIAPGITVALTVLCLTWSYLLGVKPGPVLPWIFLAASVAVLIFVRRPPDLETRRISTSEWLAAITAAIIVIIFLIVRFHAVWRWCVPPGADTAQHTMIVQLLLDHRGLFSSWMPYNDAQTFTYHFGFHAVTALFAWLGRLDALPAVFIMSRVAAVMAMLSLFGLVRLWTGNAWGGLFAIAFWQFAYDHLSSFEMTGRWTLLTGIAVMGTALTLISVYLEPKPVLQQRLLGCVCALTVAGLALTQYKSAMIFAVLVASLVVTRCLAALFDSKPEPKRRTAQIASRILVIVALALVLASPRLYAVMQTKTGHHLKRIVLEGPAATAATFDMPTLGATGLARAAVSTKRYAIVSTLALVAVAMIVFRKRQALWFVVGWAALTLMMNPRLIGSGRMGLIDETHWKLSVIPATAVLAGLAIAFISDFLPGSRGRIWNIILMIAVISLSVRGAMKLVPLNSWYTYIECPELPLMSWIKQNVPPNDRIAGRAFIGRDLSLPRDALVWLPLLTARRTNHTNLAAALEKAPPDEQQRLVGFTRELCQRDMSTPESARWLQEQGYRWFYVGALDPSWDQSLLQQLGANPSLEVAQSLGGGLLYHVR